VDSVIQALPTSSKLHMIKAWGDWSWTSHWCCCRTAHVVRCCRGTVTTGDPSKKETTALLVCGASPQGWSMMCSQTACTGCGDLHELCRWAAAGSC